MSERVDEKNLALAEHYVAVGQPQAALDALARVEGARESADVWLVRTQALLELGEPPGAATAARTGLRLEPESPELLQLLGVAEWRRGRLAEAEQALLAGLELEPDDPILLCTYAHVVANAGQLEKAESLVERALAIDPDEPFARRTRAEIAYLRGRDSAAALAGRSTLELDPDDPHTHALLGAAEYSRGQRGRAARHVRTAVALDPTEPDRVDAARALRAETHPALLPLWPVYRFGQGPVWIAGVLLLLVARAVAPDGVLLVVAAAWLLYAAYSWIAPPVVEWWVGRRAP